MKNHKFIWREILWNSASAVRLQYEGDILPRSWRLRILSGKKKGCERRKKVFFMSGGPRPSSWGQSSSDSLLITWQQLLPAVVDVHVSSTHWTQWVIFKKERNREHEVGRKTCWKGLGGWGGGQEWSKHTLCICMNMYFQRIIKIY